MSATCVDNTVYDDIMRNGHVSATCVYIVSVYDSILRKGHMFLTCVSPLSIVTIQCQRTNRFVF